MNVKKKAMQVVLPTHYLIYTYNIHLELLYYILFLIIHHL